MSGDDVYFLRVVIQQLSVCPNATYRVTVYGDDHEPRHTDFSNAQILADTLSASFPGFDLSELSLNPLGEGHGSIVYADEMKLNEIQLSLLGLR